MYPEFEKRRREARAILYHVQVVYEDDDLLAVSKPPFVSTAPRHRWEVSPLGLLCRRGIL